MLEKKKNNRPLVIDLIDYFNQTPMPNLGLTFNIKKNPIDYQNFISYSEQGKQAYDRKRLIESNQVSINDEFSALKRRVANKAKNFKANFLNYKGSGSKKATTSVQLTMSGQYASTQSSAVKSGGLSLKENTSSHQKP